MADKTTHILLRFHLAIHQTFKSMFLYPGLSNNILKQLNFFSFSAMKVWLILDYLIKPIPKA